MLYGPTRNQKPGFYRTFAETQLGEINDTQSIFLLSGLAGRVGSRESPENPCATGTRPESAMIGQARLERLELRNVSLATRRCPHTVSELITKPN